MVTATRRSVSCTGGAIARVPPITKIWVVAVMALVLMNCSKEIHTLHAQTRINCTKEKRERPLAMKSVEKEEVIYHILLVHNDFISSIP